MLHMLHTTYMLHISYSLVFHYQVYMLPFHQFEQSHLRMASCKQITSHVLMPLLSNQKFLYLITSLSLDRPVALSKGPYGLFNILQICNNC